MQEVAAVATLWDQSSLASKLEQPEPPRKILPRLAATAMFLTAFRPSRDIARLMEPICRGKTVESGIHDLQNPGTECGVGRDDLMEIACRARRILDDIDDVQRSPRGASPCASCFRRSHVRWSVILDWLLESLTFPDWFKLIFNGRTLCTIDFGEERLLLELPVQRIGFLGEITHPGGHASAFEGARNPDPGRPANPPRALRRFRPRIGDLDLGLQPNRSHRAHRAIHVR